MAVISLTPIEIGWGGWAQKLMLDATWLRNKQEIDQRGLLEQESHTTERAAEDFAKGAVKSVR
jgi:hypothetical protein